MSRWLGLAMVPAMLVSPLIMADQVQATLEWVRPLTVSVPVSGVIREVLVRPGDRVSKGQELVGLDPRPFQARVDQSKARVEAALLDRDEAKRELDRGHELYDRTVLSDHELELSKIAFAKADAEYRGAQAALVQARWALEYSVARAPFDGLIIGSEAQAGQTVVSHCQSVPLVTLVKANRLLARAELPAAAVRHLRPGQAVSVTVGAQRHPGTLERIYPGPGDRAPGRFLVDVSLSVAGDQGPYPGQQAVLELP